MNKMHKKKVRELTFLGFCIGFIIIIIISYFSWNFDLDFLKKSLVATQKEILNDSNRIAKTFLELLATSIFESFFIFVVIHNIQTKIPFLLHKVNLRHFIQGLSFLCISVFFMNLHNKYFIEYTNISSILKSFGNSKQTDASLIIMCFLILIIIFAMFVSHIYERSNNNVTSIIIIITSFNVLLWIFVGHTSADNINELLSLDILGTLTNLKNSIPIK